MKVGRTWYTCRQHGITGQQLKFHKRFVLFKAGNYMIYTMYIHCIYHVYTSRKSVASAGPLCGPRSFGSFGPRLPSDLLSFGHREAAHARLGPSKVPQPGVDRVNMAAPPRGRARTIGTAALKSVPLTAAVLMWNSCISVQKAWNERYSAERSSTLPT